MAKGGVQFYSGLSKIGFAALDRRVAGCNERTLSSKGDAMKVVAINGSHRAGKSTSKLLQRALVVFEEAGWQTQLVELASCNVEFCAGCNSCLVGKPCPLLGREGDDAQAIIDALAAADAVILASPNYFENVSARMKCLMDRMRATHLPKNILAGKVAGVVVTTGLNNSGADEASAALVRFSLAQGWTLSGLARVVGTWEEGCGEDGRARYRRGADADPQAQANVEAMARSIMDVATKLA